ncbi:MAG: rhomboid family intramembrane serine protease, partial [Thermoanaerobaculia bacterium]
HAWFSYAILAANIIAFIVLNLIVAPPIVERAEGQLRETIEYLAHHPYLEVPEVLNRFLGAEDLRYLETARRDIRLGSLTIEPRQRTLDRRAAALEESLQRLPVFRHGLVAADPSIRTLVTSMFVHVDFWHLHGNLLFFVATAPFLEDVYGRIAFPILYFFGGFAAAAMQIGTNASSEAPMVGASGAVAAVMGAYLIRFHRTRLRFLVFFVIARFITLPAWVVLPLWFLTQLAFGLTADESAGVAFSAHVGGFGFGLAFGALFFAFGLEAKYIAPRVEEQTSWSQSSDVVLAARAQQIGDFPRASALVSRVVAKEPANLEAHRIGYEVAVEMREIATAERHALKLLDLYGSLGDMELVRAFVMESLSDLGEDASEGYLSRAARLLERLGEPRDAVHLYERVANGAGREEARIQALVRAAIVSRGMGDVPRARQMLERAKALPACTGLWLQTVAAQLADCDG